MGVFRQLSKSILLSRASRLREKGDTKGALDSLFSANRKHEDDVVERDIVDLLLQLTPDDASPSKPVLSAAPEPQKAAAFHSGEIPEIHAKDLSPAMLQDAISHAGYLIVRGLFDASEAADLRTCIDESLNSRADAPEESDEVPQGPWYYPSPHFPGSHVAYSARNKKKKFGRTGSIRVIDSPRGTYKVLELYRKYRLKELLDAYFEQPSLLAMRKWVFRLIEPIPGMDDSIGGGWHQDGQFMGEGIVALNMWVALTDCGDGTDAPGITLLPKRIEEIVEFGTRGARLDWVVGGELVEELAADASIVSPRFAPGDALFFDHFSLHRSGHGPDQSVNRHALESWFYAKSAHADNSTTPYF